MSRHVLESLIAGDDLTDEVATAWMRDVMEGAVAPVPLAGVLVALAAKGETATELAAFAGVLRQKAVSIEAPPSAIDTCGTGGSGLCTPNTSTLAAFVLAAAGVPVAKHGNRSSSGRCGSADLLEAAGVAIDLGPEAVEALLAEHGFGFMLAPRFHPAMRHAGPVRRALGVRTTFNFLGPLANPAGVRRQVLGVSDPRRAPLMAAALCALGTERALLVHGSDGLDEITLTGPSELWWVEGADVRHERFAPQDIGLEPCPAASIEGGNPEDNRVIFERILGGEERGPLRDLVALNAGAGLVVAEAQDNLQLGYHFAVELIESGAVQEVFERYRDASQALAARGAEAST